MPKRLYLKGGRHALFLVGDAQRFPLRYLELLAQVPDVGIHVRHVGNLVASSLGMRRGKRSWEENVTDDQDFTPRVHKGDVLDFHAIIGGPVTEAWT